MRTITLEEHFATPGFLDGPGRELRDQARQVGGRAEQLMRDLCDLGRRPDRPDGCRGHRHAGDLAGPRRASSNWSLSTRWRWRATPMTCWPRRSRGIPTRLSGFAALAIAQPDLAAKELDRRVGGQHFAVRSSTVISAAATSTTSLLAGAGGRRSAERADLSASDQAAQGGDQGVVGGFSPLVNRDAGRPGFGLGTSKPRSTCCAWCWAACSIVSRNCRS
jgi:hypothetical protein